MQKPKPLGYRMPVIVREGGWRILIYSNDHAPPHVHARRPDGGEVKVGLPIGGRELKFMEAEGLLPWKALEGVRLVQKHVEVLVAAWERIHGLPEDH